MMRITLGLLLSSLCTHVAFAQTTITKPARIYSGHTDMMETVMFSSNGKYIFSGSWDRSINMYQADTNLLVRKITGNNSAVVSLTYCSPAGKPSFFASGSKDFAARTWDSLGNYQHEYIGYNTAITCVAIDPSGKWLFTGSAQQGINQWDLDNLAAPRQNYPVMTVNALACSKNGTLYIATNSTEVQLLKPATGLLPQRLSGADGDVLSLACSNSGKLVVTGSAKGTIMVWDAVNLKPLNTIKAHGWKVTTLAISKDERFLVSGSNDGTVKLWEISTGNLLATFEDWGYNVRSVAISPDNSQIAVAAYQRNVTEHGVCVYATAGLLPAKGAAPKPGMPGKK